MLGEGRQGRPDDPLANLLLMLGTDARHRRLLENECSPSLLRTPVRDKS